MEMKLLTITLEGDGNFARFVCIFCIKRCCLDYRKSPVRNCYKSMRENANGFKLETSVHAGETLRRDLWDDLGMTLERPRGGISASRKYKYYITTHPNDEKSCFIVYFFVILRSSMNLDLIDLFLGCSGHC